MTIPVSNIVDVGISIGGRFPERVGFGTLNIVTSEQGVIPIEERARVYNDIGGVGEDWPTSSQVYVAANAYFSQQPRPTELVVSVRAPETTLGALVGGTIIDFADFIDDINGIDEEAGFDVTVNGQVLNIRGIGINFSLENATTADPLCNEVEQQFNAELQNAGINATVTCGYDVDEARFTIQTTPDSVDSLTFTGNITGPFGPNEEAFDNLARIMALRTESGGTLVEPVEGETVTQALTNIMQVNNDWYGFIFTNEVRDDAVINGEDAVISAAVWAEARTKVFATVSNDANSLSATSETDIGSLLQDREFRRTMWVYSSQSNEYPDASAFGRAFTTNFDIPNSTITLNFKQLPGITVEQLTQNQYAVLQRKYGNAFISVGTVSFFSESFMSNGIFFDEVHGIDWLTNAIQTNVFGYLVTRPTKVPYTDQGVAALEQQLINALEQARVNGLIAPGETIDGEFLANGYLTNTIPVADIDQGSVEARFYGGLSFTILGAGAIHGVQINGIFER